MAEHALDQDAGTSLLGQWRDTEPVRLWLYGIAVPLLALLIGYGLLTAHTAALWLAFVQAVMLAGGTELARGFTVSPATANAVARYAAGSSATSDELAARTAVLTFRVPYLRP